MKKINKIAIGKVYKILILIKEQTQKKQQQQKSDEMKENIGNFNVIERRSINLHIFAKCKISHCHELIRIS